MNKMDKFKNELSQEEKLKMLQNLEKFVEANPAKSPSKIYSFFTTLKPATLALSVFIFVATTTFAAQFSSPGNPLYPIKVLTNPSATPTPITIEQTPLVEDPDNQSDQIIEEAVEEPGIPSLAPATEIARPPENVDTTIDNTTSTTTEIIDETLDSTTDLLDETVDETADLIDETIDQTTDLLDSTTDEVLDTTEDVTETLQDTLF